MPNKTISLDEKSSIIAARIPNFSRWVRYRLLEYSREGIPAEEGDHEDPHYAPPAARVWGSMKDKCNPRHIKGFCPTCWGEE